MKSLFLVLICSFLINSVTNPVDSRTITGNIINEQGDPVAALVKAGNIHATADAKGNYSIKISGESVLEFSAKGFETEKIQIGKQNVYNIVMKSDQTEVEELLLVRSNLSTQKVASIGLSRINGRYPSMMVSPGFGERDIFNTEEYDYISENGFKKVSDNPLSTFSIDVDAASYSNVRRFLQNNELPPAGAVRSEEMINYFKYDYPQPSGEDPFSVNTVLVKLRGIRTTGCY